MRMRDFKEGDFVLVDGNKMATIVNVYPDNKTFEVEIIYFDENVKEMISKDRITLAIKKQENI